MENLLTCTRRINRLIQRTCSYPVDFDEMAGVIRDVLAANVYVINARGECLGYALEDDFECDSIRACIEKGKFPDNFNEYLLQIHETVANIVPEDTKCLLYVDEQCMFPNKLAMAVPIFGASERLGTLMISRFDIRFTEQDIVLAEYGATVIGMEIIRSRTEESEEERRKKNQIQVAIDTLSYSELEALDHIFKELNGNEGILIASKIADEVGITRSVIVNALRKLESAGVIESRSLGMKGTHLRILNDMLLDELRKAQGK
jgi:transcriptional pleiotropic repressor